MAKQMLENKRNSEEISLHSVDSDKANTLDNQQSGIKNEYFEFKAEDQLNVYSYATDSEGSNGTVSTYTEGRIGLSNSYDNNKKEANNLYTGNTDNAKILNRNTRTKTSTNAEISGHNAHTKTCADTYLFNRTASQENSARANILSRTAYQENSTNAKILKRYTHTENSARAKISSRNAYSEKSANTKREGTRNGLALVSYNTGSVQSQPVTIEQSSEELSDSIRSTSTTYDKIVHIDNNIGEHTGTSRKSENNNGCCSLGRCIFAMVVLGILIAVSVLIYIFVIDKQSNDACDGLPTIKDGTTKRTSSDKVTITCDPGFVLHGNSTITCVNNKWDGNFNCAPVMCGPYLIIENGFINGSERLFRSKANITCNPGFLKVDDISTITCLENGSWSSVGECREHPCGEYTLSDDMVAVNDLLFTTNTLCVSCIPGLRYVPNSETCVTCENGEWQGSPACEIPGSITFDPIKEVYNVSQPLTLTCVVQNTSEWQSIVLVRSDFHGEVIEPLFKVTNNSGDIQIQNLLVSEASTFDARYNLTQNGAAVIYEVRQSRCEDSGVYICGNVVGAYTSPINVKYANISVYITDTESGVPEIVVPDIMYEGVEATITCSGELGIDSNDTLSGELMIQIKHKDGASFETLPSFKINSLIENCRMKETVVSTVVPTMGMQGAFVRCIVLDDNKINITSLELQLNIVLPTVNILPRPSVFDIGDTANLTCTMNFVDGWETVEIHQICSGNEIVIARIEVDSQNEPFLVDEHIRLTQTDIQTDYVSFVLMFEPVQCSDACGKVDTIQYEAAVRIKNDTWIQNLTNVIFQRQPGVPDLQIAFNGIDGNNANFKCSGEVGDPKGYLEIESKFEGSNFTMFLSNRDGFENNGSGSITSTTDTVGECSTVRTINFQINTVTSKYHNKMVKCIAKPSISLENGKAVESEAEVLEIIPDNYCSEPQGFTGVIRHPFHCNMFVQCHSGQVIGVPAGCKQDDCFYGTTCYSCESIGGCSVTDIFIDNFVDMIHLGDPVTLICKVKDFQGLTDITIYKDTNNSVISSFQNGETDIGFTRVTEYSFITGNSGQLTLYIPETQCENVGTYHCVPEGIGKHSEDRTNLLLKDADGNNIC